MQRFNGKTVVVTGGVGGIGGATSRRFAGEGAKVAVLDLNLQAAEAVVAQIRAAGGQAAAFQADITQRLEHIEQTLEGHAGRLSRLDAELARVPTDEDLEKIYARINASATDLAEVKGTLRGISDNLRTLMARITERGLQ